VALIVMTTSMTVGGFVGATNIQNKIKFGLSKAFDALGESDSPLVYVVKSTSTGGSSPLDPPVITTEDVLLKNAVFDDVSNDLIDGTLIRLGDSIVTSDSDVEVVQGDVIKRGSELWDVVTVIKTDPFGFALVYEPVVRLK